MPDRVARGGAHAKPPAWRLARTPGPDGAVAWSRPARLLGLLPLGTLPVGAGLLVLGIGMYTHLAVAGHRLPTSGLAAFAVLWSLVFLLGLGIFLPIEQELIRLVAARSAMGEGSTGVVHRFCALSVVILAVMFVPLAAAAQPLARLLFGGDTAMVLALACACVAMAVTTVSRGVLAGLGKFTAYGGQLAADGGGRILLAAVLGLAGTRSAVMFGFVLTVAPLMSVAVTLGPVARGLRPGPVLPWRATSGRLCMLIATMLLAQVIINAAVISGRLLSPGDPAAVSALLAASVLARVPLFVFTSLQTALLPGLAGAIAAGNRARYRMLLGRACGVVLLLGIVGGLPVTFLGPCLIRVLFRAHPVLGDASFAWFAFGTLCYMLAMVLGQGAMALSRHRDQLLAWAAGVTVLAVTTIVPGEVTMRVVTAYGLGCGAVATALAVVLARHPAAAGGGAAREVRAWPMPNR
jgi:O-antigen/teichoic acid export membrane protein